MDAEDTVAELCALLCMLPGVAIEAIDVRRPEVLLIDLTIQSIESFGPLAYAAQAANVRLDFYSTAPSQPVSARADPRHVIFQIVSGASSDDSALSNLQFFGIYLVWYLHAVGSLPTIAANHLLTVWRGRQVNDRTET